jgi:MraZ protein
VDRFVSHYVNRFDAKGRISIPAPFRAVLARDGYDGLFVCPSLDAPALDCGGEALLRRIDALLDARPAWSAERDAFASALLGTSEILKPDSEGRVMLSETMRGIAGLDREAAFVGHGHKFQIWEPVRLRAHLEQATARVRELRNGGIPAAGAATREHGG